MLLSRNQRASLNGVAANRAFMARTGHTFAGDLLWTAPEDDILREHYPDANCIRRLINRTEDAIRGRARRLGLTKPCRVWDEREFRTMKAPYVEGAPVPEIADSLDRKTPKQVYGKASSRKIRRPPKPPRPTGFPLADSVRARAFEMSISLRALDIDVGSGSYFRRPQSTNFQYIAKALEMLGGRAAIRWSDETE